ncbi:MAG: purine-binding chemotaxis protein CheW [Acidobacteriota bacterium]|jgi:purine-binding chemotaxis protein CheW|nr:purine-binding chemotaxis protein CheW [Acidobacteriota bacterium]
MVDLVKIRKKIKKKITGEEPVVETSHVETPAEPLSPQSSVLSPEPRSSSTKDSGLRTQDSLPTTDKLAKFKEEAGRRRELDFTSTETTDGEILELLAFRIAGEQYAVEIERIVEIVTPRPVTRIPNADAAIVGIISLRGTIVTVMDVRRRLRHPPAGEENVDARIVVVEYGGETLGFEVDHVSRVVKIERATIEPHPVVHTSEQRDAIRGVFRHANALTILVDLDKLLDARAPSYGTNL